MIDMDASDVMCDKLWSEWSRFEGDNGNARIIRGGGGVSGVRGSRLKELISNEGSEMIALDGVV